MEHTLIIILDQPAVQAVVPSYLLNNYDYNDISGKIVNVNDMKKRHEDQIINLFARLGITPDDRVPQDLKKFIGNMQVFNRILSVGWE